MEIDGQQELQEFDRARMTTNLVSNAIVHNVLTEHNYADWSICMKNYLLGQDLWDVVKTGSKLAYTEAKFPTWKQKNYMALHAIQISCGIDVLSEIREITSAKVAWDLLAYMLGKPSQGVINDRGSSSDDPSHDPRSSPQGVNETENSPQGVNETDSLLYSPGMEYLHHLPLLKALESGDWDKAKVFLDLRRDAYNPVSAKITSSGKTALHIVTIAGHMEIVEELVKLMSEEELEIQDMDGCTALAAAASSGVTQMAKFMVQKNSRLPNIEDKNGTIPVVVASGKGHIDMTRYLFQFFLPEQKGIEKDTSATLLCNCIVAKIFDVALKLLLYCPRLAFAPGRDGLSPVYVLAQMPSAFPSGSRLVFWKRWIYSCIRVQPHSAYCCHIPINFQHEGSTDQGNIIPVLGRLHGLVSSLLELFGIKQIYDQKLVHVQALELLCCICGHISTLDDKLLAEGLVYGSIFQAVKFGIVEFIIEIVNTNPNLVWSIDMDSRDMFFFAIEYRQEKIFSLLYGLDARKSAISSRTDNFSNNMLHLAAMLAPSSQLARISGAALQMQRELQWFKEVESIVQPKCREALNADGKTPCELFTENHEDLVKEGEKWMKGAATSCTVVAALIVTIMFAAAFTVPGGNKENTGTPIFLGKKLFMVFIVSCMP